MIASQLSKYIFECSHTIRESLLTVAKPKPLWRHQKIALVFYHRYHHLDSAGASVLLEADQYVPNTHVKRHTQHSTSALNITARLLMFFWYVDAYVTDVNTSRTPEDGAHSPSWPSGRLIVIISYICTFLTAQRGYQPRRSW